jgi:hypothetical protein
MNKVIKLPSLLRTNRTHLPELFDERDGGDRHHEVSILIASCLMVGQWRGTQPAANVSMIAMREPQHGQGCVGCSIDAAASSLHFIFAASEKTRLVGLTRQAINVARPDGVKRMRWKLKSGDRA